MKLKPENDSADVSRYDAFSEEYGLLFSDTDKVSMVHSPYYDERSEPVGAVYVSFYSCYSFIKYR